VLPNPSRHWTRLDVIVLLAAFTLLYVIVRSSLLIGDAAAFIEFARTGDPAGLHYGEPSHFLQVLLTRALWLAGMRLGLPVTAGGVLVSLSIAGTIVAVAGFAAIAGELLGSRTAAWLGAVLYGTSLQVWSQANGELYGMAAAFATCAIYAALRRRSLTASILFALAVLSHADFVLTLPALLIALRLGDPSAGRAIWTRHALVTCATSGVLVLLVLLSGSRAVGKWHDRAGLVAWVQRSYATRQQDIDPPQPVRALKGLLTADTVGGHVLRDLATGRGPLHDPWFVTACAIGILVTGLTTVLAAAAIVEWRIALFALAWMLPAHILINWRFIPTVEKYHAAALPGFILLILTGLIAAGRLARRHGRTLQLAFVAIGALFNLFGALLPIRALGVQISASTQAVSGLIDATGGRAVFVSCDNPQPLTRAKASFLRIRSIWRAAPVEIQTHIIDWTTMQLASGHRVFVVGDRCLPEEWITKWSKAPFSLRFLDEHFAVEAPAIHQLPITQESMTDPFGGRYGDVHELRPRTYQSQPR
jgi:hypothetical protein